LASARSEQDVAALEPKILKAMSWLTSAAEACTAAYAAQREAKREAKREARRCAAGSVPEPTPPTVPAAPDGAAPMTDVVAAPTPEAAARATRKLRAKPSVGADKERPRSKRQKLAGPPAAFHVGDRVEAHFRGGSAWYRGTIKEGLTERYFVSTYSINFDDDFVDEFVEDGHIRRLP
jgi:hypothetical protein